MSAFGGKADNVEGDHAEKSSTTYDRTRARIALMREEDR